MILAPIPTALVGQVEFYSDGIDTVLAPTGWTCAAFSSSQGVVHLVVYPSNNPDPPVGTIVAPGTEGVFATFASTGQVPGIAMVCPFFTIPSWQRQEAKCPVFPPSGQSSTMSTPDVASVTDPDGVIGSLVASGGSLQVTGLVIFPQIEPQVTDGSSIAVDSESCSLTDSTLCATVLSDFAVREFPTPPGS